jgi:hypothetical protein
MKFSKDLLWETNEEHFSYREKPLIKIKACYSNPLKITINSKTYIITVNGVVTVTPRKSISCGKTCTMYKIVMSDISLDTNVIGFEEGPMFDNWVFPVVPGKGLLFGKIKKKISVDKKTRSAVFSINEHGKFLI